MVLIVGALMIAVLVLTMSGCASKKRRHSTSSRPAATSTAQQQPFRDCAEAWKAGKAPVRRADSGYSIQLDRLDGTEDGTACAARPTIVPTR
ncbi:excalibur calcium-binding domain-containing protein [Nocardia sp. NBC_00508]|uniref:excalibur calcium-binding domain-containing protein n=1 Tax=Nocardia sp. NBC_00508 TaxID=2975992 RepID=UPI002E80DC4E|nr:excalibur calcium-binding domain-containing protein [Nocardia sp. NBC_00508]WUD68198.1 excalibur calcium-binding domain-containing protein [Nocardia sp. NBC_00508]